MAKEELKATPSAYYVIVREARNNPILLFINEKGKTVDSFWKAKRHSNPEEAQKALFTLGASEQAECCICESLVDNSDNCTHLWRVTDHGHTSVAYVVTGTDTAGLRAYTSANHKTTTDICQAIIYQSLNDATSDLKRIQEGKAGFTLNEACIEFARLSVTTVRQVTEWMIFKGSKIPVFNKHKPLRTLDGNIDAEDLGKKSLAERSDAIKHFFDDLTAGKSGMSLSDADFRSILAQLDFWFGKYYDIYTATVVAKGRGKGPVKGGECKPFGSGLPPGSIVYDAKWKGSRDLIRILLTPKRLMVLVPEAKSRKKKGARK